MKKLLLFVLISVLALSLSAQVIDNFPTTEGFEGSSNPGSHNFFLSWNAGWSVTDEPANSSSPITGGCNSSKFVYCYSPNTLLSDTLETYAFDLTNAENAKLSFWYANPDWSGDYDYLKIGIRTGNSSNYSIVYVINSPHDSWTYFEYDLPVFSNEYIQICFIAETNQGYGVYLDNIKVDVPAPSKVADFPWWEGFDDMSMWTQSYENLNDDKWFLRVGNLNSDQNSEINSEQAECCGNNAIYYSAHNNGGWLISPILKLGSVQSTKVAFYYSKEADGDHIDEFGLYYRVNPSSSWVELDYFGHNEDVPYWQAASYFLPNLSNEYQIGFYAIGHYGYGVTIDDINVYLPVGISETEEENNAISVYPNPAKEFIAVERKANDEIFIYNIYGSLVKRTFDSRIDVSGFTPGIYTVRTSEGTVKFVK